MFFQEIVRLSNHVWHAMYYDELLECPEWQISYLKGEDRLYFNCAQTLQFFQKDTLFLIEKYFKERNILPAIYLDPESSPDWEKFLLKKGYQPVEEELEIWYKFLLTANNIQAISYEIQTFEAQNPNLQCLIFSPLTSTHYLEEFLALNAVVNGISPSIIEKLRQNLIKPKRKDVQFFCVVAIEQAKIIAVCMVSFYQNIAFFSGGATHPDFRRRGIHKWITQYRLMFCQAMQTTQVVVNCDKMAYSNKTYQRLGFDWIGNRRFFLKN